MVLVPQKLLRLYGGYVCCASDCLLFPSVLGLSSAVFVCIRRSGIDYAAVLTPVPVISPARGHDSCFYFFYFFSCPFSFFVSYVSFVLVSFVLSSSYIIVYVVPVVFILMRWDCIVYSPFTA